MRRGAAPTGVAAGFGGRVALVECMIHQQVIRRPLELVRAVPEDRLAAALNFARASPVIRGAFRARGVRLVATDLAWSAGRGRGARGSGEALLLAMAGRRAALPDLSGPGAAVLTRR
jgi:hypothetical protein